MFVTETGENGEPCSLPPISQHRRHSGIQSGGSYPGNPQQHSRLHVVSRYRVKHGQGNLLWLPHTVPPSADESVLLHVEHHLEEALRVVRTQNVLWVGNSMSITKSYSLKLWESWDRVRWKGQGGGGEYGMENCDCDGLIPATFSFFPVFNLVAQEIPDQTDHFQMIDHWI